MIVRVRLFCGVAAAFFSLASGVLPAQELVTAGSGSYVKGLPAGVKGPPERIYRTYDVAGKPMPTNDWWSSLAWVPLSDAMFPHPLAVKAVAGGLAVWYPGAALAANQDAIMGAGGQDLVIGVAGAAPFSEANVAGWSDWFVTARFGSKKSGLDVTFGHGSPFVFAQYLGAEPEIRVASTAKVSVEADATLRIDGGDRFYAVFPPQGTVWKETGKGIWRADCTDGRVAVALLPDRKPETLALFRKHAYARVLDSKVSWSYDQETNTVRTDFTFETEAAGEKSPATLYALYPHQVQFPAREGAAEFTGHVYQSVRGPMRLAVGQGFATETPLPATLPAVPLTVGVNRAELRGLMERDLAADDAAGLSPDAPLDTYWLGKRLGKWAALRPLAEQAGERKIADECARRIRLALENMFDASNPGLFAYEPNWGVLIGYPASFGSDDQLNDHHFHYGYFLRAAAELARTDKAWVETFRPLLDLLVRDVVSPDRDDAMFPFLRCFDPYAGHTWASGHAKFADGNNNESSSEAVNAWFGLMMLGELAGNKEWRDLGAWLLALEVSAINAYWFDVTDEFHHPDYTPSVVTMIWGGKGANGTWFSANPEAVHGINFLPVTGAHLYLGTRADYVAKNYAALVKENGGDHFDQWADILWMYHALSDPAAAKKQWDARAADFRPEQGNSLAQTSAWITMLNDLGLPQVFAPAGAGAPFRAVFEKNGKTSVVTWDGSQGPKITAQP